MLVKERTMTKAEINELDRRDKRIYTALKNEVRDLKRAVRGYNGDTGLIGHAEKTDLALKILKKGQDDIKLLLTGDDTKLDDDGGLKGRQRERAKREKTIIRLFWIVIGVFCSGTGGLIFYSIQLNLVGCASP